MKTKLSISLDRALLARAEALIEEGRFRNKSHVLEYALKILMTKENKEELK